MSETITDTAAAPVAPIVPPVVAPPKVDADTEVRMTPAQLKERLAETRAAAEKRAAETFAAELGIPIADAKKLIADAKAKDDAQKSEVQRLTEQLAARDAKLAEFGVYKSAVDTQAAAELAALTEEQRAAVEAIAGESPAARLKAIAALRPTWSAAQKAADATAVASAQAAKEAADKAAAEAAKAAAEAKKTAPIPAPANTTPAAAPPVPAQPGTPTNHHAVWESLKVSNPAAAARYRVQHEAAIRAAQRNATG